MLEHKLALHLFLVEAEVEVVAIKTQLQSTVRELSEGSLVPPNSMHPLAGPMLASAHFQEMPLSASVALVALVAAQMLSQLTQALTAASPAAELAAAALQLQAAQQALVAQGAVALSS